MSDSTNWAKYCRYAALANIAAVMALAFALIRLLLKVTEEQGDISPSLIGFDGSFHLPFLFVAILTLLLAKKAPIRIQQGLSGLNAGMALYTMTNVLSLLGE